MTGGNCIKLSQICDYIIDCIDASDEYNCKNYGKRNFSCIFSRNFGTPNKFLLFQDFCDTTTPDGLKCDNGQCLSCYDLDNSGNLREVNTKKCDGKIDCLDGSDEKYCSSKYRID